MCHYSLYLSGLSCTSYGSDTRCGDTATITVVLLGGQSKKEQVAKILCLSRLTKKRNRKVKVKSPSWKVCWGVEALKIDLYNVDLEKDGNMDDNDVIM